MNKNIKNLNDRLIYICISAILMLVVIITLYPIIYIISLSFSSKEAVELHKVWFFPVGFNIVSYKIFLSHHLLLRAYSNTILYTVCGTFYSLILTIFGGYALSRRNLIGKNFFMMMIAFTMMFNGGLIPTFLLVKDVGLYNKWLALIIPCAVSQIYLIIMRTSMQQIPDSMEDSCKIDGANDIQILFKIYIPMCIPVIATISLFYAVDKWNDYFRALIYLNNSKLYPVQLVIRDLLIKMTDNMLYHGVSSSGDSALFAPASFKSAVVLVTMAPIMALYPFIQKYFVKGVMIGAIKG